MSHAAVRRLAIAMMLLTVACSGERDGDDGDGGATTTGSATAPASSVQSGEALSIELSGDAGSVTLGEPLQVTIEVRNPGRKSVSTPVELTLSTPSGRSIPFHRTNLFVPFGDIATESVSVTPTRWVGDIGSFEIDAAVTDPTIDAGRGALGFEVTATDRVVPVFEDVTEQAGVATSVPSPECGQFANGAAWGDVDGDSWPDLVVTRLSQPSQLFVNRGDGTFADESAGRGVDARSANGAAFADYDADGDLDLLLVGDGPDALLRNDGAGHFDDVTATAGVAGDPDARGMSGAWGDFDGDGLLDLYVTNYMHCTGPWTTEGEIIANVAYYADVLYRNDGDGTFSDVTDLLPGRDVSGAGFSAAWIDPDADGGLDLYLGNDFVGISPDPNRLWRNTRDGTTASFADESLESGAGLYMNTMGIGIGDVDRDGNVDLALSNIGGNKLLRGNGDATFTEQLASGIERPMQGVEHNTVTWGTVVADFDLDGWDDVFMAAGNLPQGPEVVIGDQPNMLFLNDATGERLLDVSALTGLDEVGDSKGVAAADYDGDGAIDLFVVDQNGAPHLYRNVTPRGERHWVELDLPGNPCGARVAITAGEATITRFVTCGSGGTGSANHTRVHAGIGAATSIDKVEVTMPNGETTTLENVQPDQIIGV